MIESAAAKFRRAAVPLLVVAGLLLAGGARAEGQNPYAAKLAPATTDRIIVKFRPATVRAQASRARLDGLGQRARLGVLAAREIDDAGALQVVRVPGIESVGGLENAVARLRADASVEFAIPDERMYAHAVPNDPVFTGTPGVAGQTGQWYMQAPVATPAGTTASATNAVAAWDVTTGVSSVVVAVIDTGVRFDHPDLGRVGSGGKLLPGYDFVSADSGGGFLNANDGDGWDADPSDPGDWLSTSDQANAVFRDCQTSDSSWHGTRVAGIVGALTNNGLGVAGFGWGTRILPVRVLGKCGGFTSDIIAGMRWAAGLSVSGAPVNPNPAKILNLSLGGQGDCSAAYQSAIDEIVARGVLVVVSAGNDGSAVDQPANCRGVAAVGAVRHVGTKVGFSNLGPLVALSAPGGNCVNVDGGPCLFSIDTTTNLGTTSPGANDYTNQTRFNVGTSFSAPIVSGIASLVYSVNAALTPAQVIARLQGTARAFPFVNEIDPVTNQPIPQCRVPSGASDIQTNQCNCTLRTCGAGMADAGAALTSLNAPLAAVVVRGTAGPGQTVQLDAVNSSAGTGATLATYAWTVQPGATGSPVFTSPGSASTSITLPTSGSLAVQLTVTDTRGGSHSTVVRLLSAVPNVAGQAQAAAAAALRASDLEVGSVSTQPSATVANGSVISQSPAAGGSAAAGSAVALVVSSGASQISVPNVVGQTQSGASTTLTNAGLAVGTVTTQASSSVAAGTVISQSPAAGSTAQAGASVSLVVSSGPAASSGGGGGGGGGGALDVLTLAAGLLLAGVAAVGRRRRA